MDRDRAAESVERLARRVASVAEELTSAHLPALPDFGHLPSWIVTGVGASEGPARLLVAQLLEQGVRARYAPVTSFLGPEPPAADALVVVSQRLSPNGRLPLRHHARYRRTVVVTSLSPEVDERCRALAGENVTFVTHAPAEEDGLILRVVGPALATRAVLHLAEHLARSRGEPPPPWCARTAELGGAVARAAGRARPIEPEWAFGPTAILTAGDDAVLAVGLRTKLLEALAVPEPPIWDLCGVVHGPLQSFFDTRCLLLVLEPTAPSHATLLRRRLEQIVVPERHSVVVVRAELPSPLSYFEYAAAFDAIVVDALRRRPRDLGEWPSKGKDAPLYAIDERAILD